jgi:hypothetical protein
MMIIVNCLPKDDTKDGLIIDDDMHKRGTNVILYLYKDDMTLNRIEHRFYKILSFNIYFEIIPTIE